MVFTIGTRCWVDRRCRLKPPKRAGHVEPKFSCKLLHLIAHGDLTFSDLLRLPEFNYHPLQTVWAVHLCTFQFPVYRKSLHCRNEGKDCTRTHIRLEISTWPKWLKIRDTRAKIMATQVYFYITHLEKMTKQILEVWYQQGSLEQVRRKRSV